MKKILSLLLMITLLATAIIPFASAQDDSTPAEAGYYYVYTENGLELAIRDEPSFHGKRVGWLKYGARIYVDAFTNENWALITYHYDKPGYGPGDYAAWVNRRFIQKTKPASKPSSGSSGSSTSGDALTEINTQFKSAKMVDEYTITVRPTRVTSWVNLRWAPTKKSELMATYRANDKLIVICEMTDWLQVRDPDTGNVGFLNKVFVAK